MENIHPLVSIVCCSFNHVSYIRQCLDGFIMQTTNFPIEMLIHDDASTDGTQDIIREYEKKYPDMIKPIYQTENQYSKGIEINLVYNFPRAKGKYIAFCEGDDYWTDPLKLQKQYDFMESHPNYVLCTHYYREFFQMTNEFGSVLPYYSTVREEKTFDLNYFVSNIEWVTQPLTALFLNSALDVELCKKYDCFTDVLLFYTLLKNGKGFLMADVMGVYRITGKGVWTGLDDNGKNVQSFVARIAIYDADPSRENALYFLTQFRQDTFSRILFFKNPILVVRIVHILWREFGMITTCKTLFSKILKLPNVKLL